MNTCKRCEVVFTKCKNSLGYYCSIKCQQDYQVALIIADWKQGLIVGYKGVTKQLKAPIRKYILKKANYSCVKCQWNKRHPVDDLPLVEVNHIDGDAENCHESNLEVLCPNCHSETHNFRARNKNSKRNRK